LTTKTAASLTT
jgi:hypothetical protein